MNKNPVLNQQISVQYRYTDQFSRISPNFANLLICNYFLLLQPSLSFAPLTQTAHLTQRLKIPLRKECRFDSGPGHHLMLSHSIKTDQTRYTAPV